MRDDPRRVGRCRADVADDVAAGAGAAGLGNRLVAADVVGVHVRVHHVADRFGADRLDGVDELGAERRELGVHHHHALAAHLDRGVAAGADEHVDVAAHRLHVDLDVVEVLRGSRCRTLRLGAQAAADRERRAGGEKDASTTMPRPLARWGMLISRTSGRRPGLRPGGGCAAFGGGICFRPSVTLG